MYGFRLAVTRTPGQDEIERIVASYTRQLKRFRAEPDAAARTGTASSLRSVVQKLSSLARSRADTASSVNIPTAASASA